MVNDDKLQSLIAYIAEKVQPGKVKLFKLMFLADFTAQAELGRSISGEMYENFDMGPVPQTVWKNFDSIMSRSVVVESVPTGNGMMDEQRLRASRHVFVPQLSTHEQEIVDRVLAQWGNWSGNQLKEFTHKLIPYRATPKGDTIPYGLAGYLHYKKPSQADVNEVLADESLVADLRVALQRVRRAS